MCVFIYWGMKLCYCRNHSNGGCMNQFKKWNDNRSLIPWGAKVPMLKIKFCSQFLLIERESNVVYLRV